MMQFHPRALLVSAVFITLLWFTLERGFGFVAAGMLVALALDAVFGWGHWYSIPDQRFAWFRRSRRGHKFPLTPTTKASRN